MPSRFGLPQVGRESLEVIGRRFFAGDVDSKARAYELLADDMEARADERIVRDALVFALSVEFDKWVKDHATPVAPPIDGGNPVPPLGENGYQDELFPWLSAVIEVSPARFVPQAAMTGADWDKALRQAEVKKNNGTGHYEDIKRAYDKVRPLLSGDLTTGEVIADAE